jgi:hypothetical protein
MRTALLATIAGLAVLAGCKSQPLAIEPQPAVSSAPSPTRLDLDALEQKKQADAAARSRIQAALWGVIRDANDLQDIHRRVEELIYSDCDKEFGAQYRSAAMRRADELIANREVDQPRTLAQGVDLVRRAYREVAAED